MRILHTEASEGWGGQDLRVLHEVQEMTRRGHEVTIACAPNCPLAQAAAREGVRIHPIRFGRKIRWRDVRAVRRAIARFDPQIVNTHSSADGWSGAVAARLSKRICVRTRHLSNPMKRNAPNRFLYSKLTDFVMTTGEALRETLIRDNGIEATKIRSVPTGIDLEQFDPAKWQRADFRGEIAAQGDEFVWCIVAIIRRMKGHMILAEAAAEVLKSHPRARFVVVGGATTPTPNIKKFEARLRELGIFERFVMTGMRDDVPRILAGCDAFVLPSLWGEGVPQALMQAQAMKLPVVSTQVGGIPEIVRDSKSEPNPTGWIVAPNDEKALSAAMLSVIQNPDEARRRAQNGRDLIVSEYSITAMADRVETIYTQLLQEKSASETTFRGDAR